MKKRPLRYIWTILIFLLLGAILNVAVAWGCALLIDDRPPARLSSVPGQDYIATIDWERYPKWNLMSWNRFGSTQIYSIPSGDGYSREHIEAFIRCRIAGIEIEVHIPSWSRVNSDVVPEYGSEEMVLIEDSRGFPMYALCCTFNTTVVSGSPIENSTQWGIELPFRTGRIFQWSGGRALPLYPIWSGFIFNTLFYATPLWLLFPGRYLWRRRRRIRRGRCGQCGYIVAPNIGVPGASPNCPECGTPISPGTPIPGTRSQVSHPPIKDQ